MSAALEHQFEALHKRLAALANPGVADINAATDFAIDANAGGRADLSIRLLEPLTARAAGHAKIWQLVGLAYRDEQIMDKAQAAFDRAVLLAPKDPRIALGKAQIALETGQPAADLFRPIRALVPGDGEVALSTAAALVSDGQSEAAMQLIAAMLEQQPGWLRGQDALATMRWIGGDKDGFARQYAVAAGLHPQDLALRLAHYRAVSQVGQWDAARAILAQGRTLFGDRIELDAAAAYVATESGDDESAELYFNRAAGIDDPGTKVSHIRHCIRIGQIERAERVGTPMLGGPAANTVWPYMSVIWRLLGNERAQWLDGAPPMVRHFDLPVGVGQLDALAQRLRRLHRNKHHPPEQSLRQGTQTEGHLFLRLEPELIAIRALIVDAVREYVATLPVSDAGHPLLGTPRGHLLFAGAWSVRLAAQGFHVCHTHPLGWISSAFYVALPDAQALGPAPAGWLQIGAPPPDLRVTLEPYDMIEPKPGRLVLFPSTMWHGTVPFDDGERLTIAFDVRTPSR